MPYLINIEFECYELPDPGGPDSDHPYLGIQSQAAVTQEVAYQAGQVLHFWFPIEVETTQDPLKFKGPFVQGPAQQPFVYLCWGSRTAGIWITSRRAKFFLQPITREMVLKADQNREPLRIRIKMTNSKGEPAAATLKPDQFQILG